MEHPEASRKVKNERRRSPFRRQVNEAFTDPNGQFSISKFLAVWTQIAVLAHMNRYFDELLGKPETLLIILSFLIAPEIFKKALAMKYGGSAK